MGKRKTCSGAMPWEQPAAAQCALQRSATGVSRDALFARQPEHEKIAVQLLKPVMPRRGGDGHVAVCMMKPVIPPHDRPSMAQIQQHQACQAQRPQLFKLQSQQIDRQSRRNQLRDGVQGKPSHRQIHRNVQGIENPRREMKASAGDDPFQYGYCQQPGSNQPHCMQGTACKVHYRTRAKHICTFR